MSCPRTVVINEYVKDTYTNFFTDCTLWQKYNLSHECYMENITDKLLRDQDSSFADCDYGVSPRLNDDFVHDIHDYDRF